MKQQDYDEVVEAQEQIAVCMETLTRILKRDEPHLYNQWKAYGKCVSNEFVGQHTLSDIVEQINVNEEQDEEQES